MSNTNIFEKATRLKITFNFKGTISIYDLWDLKLEDLDVLYRQLNKESKTSAAEGEGLLGSRKTKADAVLDLKKEIVKYIFTVLSEEKDKKAAQALRKQKGQELLALIAEKEKEGLKGKSVDDLRKEFAELQTADDE
jgi:NAD(P)H-nitrite reductase large subunit